MCTATWIVRDGGYQLFFNRDELRTRGRALAPTVRSRNGVRYVAPTDADSGGTWLAANEHGVTIGLLNGEGAHPSGSDAIQSRGRLIPELVDARSVDGVLEHLGTLDHGRFRPFDLLTIDPTGRAITARWDGTALAVDRDLVPGSALVSSSRDPKRARTQRRSLLDRMRKRHGVLTGELLETFHASHDPRPGPYSVCMHRDDACTVSFSRVSVDERSVEMRYQASAPCEHSAVNVERILRSSAKADRSEPTKRSTARG